MDNEPLEVALLVTQSLDKLGVSYLIGGSVASTLYGEPRATMDADIIADLRSFVRKHRVFDHAQFARRSSLILLRDPKRTSMVASAEDSILAKLEWYRMGRHFSDRQWRDVLAILREQGARLDRKYLEGMSKQPGESDLLIKAWAQAT